MAKMVTPKSTARSELDRIVADIAQAVGKSSLVPEAKEVAPKGDDDDDDKSRYYHLRSNNRATGSSSCCSSRLADVPHDKLEERIKPIWEALERIDAQKLLDLKLAKDGPRVKNGVCCCPVHGKIRPKVDKKDEQHKIDGCDSVFFTPRANSNNHHHDESCSVVRYLHIAEVPDRYTIGIFVFGPHERIPLHDHPEMCVLSRVLYGDLQRLSLDLDPNTPEVHSPRDSRYSWLVRGASWLRDSFQNNGNLAERIAQEDLPEGSRIAYTNGVDSLVAPDIAALFPYKGNLHGFIAGPRGAAVLDVLLPPYDDGEERDCTFYDVREMRNAMYTNSQRKPCLVIPTGQPENFHCISGHYRHLGESSDHCTEDDESLSEGSEGTEGEDSLMSFDR